MRPFWKHHEILENPDLLWAHFDVLTDAPGFWRHTRLTGRA